MPEISRFLGIVIRMYFDEHRPPHFHAAYGRWQVAVDIRTGMVRGPFPRRAARLVREWQRLHQDELLINWRLAESREPLRPIAPLE